MNEPPKKVGDWVSPQSAERLDSWKEIAAHLDRSVRTVRRWEENESLPVRRHHHGKGSTVFALKSELDAWLAERFESPRGANRQGEEPAVSESPESRGSVPDSETTDPTIPTGEPFEIVEEIEAVAGAGDPARAVWPRNERGRAAGWLTVGALAAMLAGAFALLPQRAREMSLLTQPSARVVLADVDVRDSGPISEEVVASLLRRELRRTPVFELTSRDEVDDALRRMRMPIGAPLDEETARSVSWRLPEIDALILPKIEQVGRSYVVDLDVVDPARGANLAQFSEPFESIDDLMPAVRAVTDSAARIVASRTPGEAGGAVDMPTVTTASGDALRIYAEADQLRRRNRSVAAERLLHRALDADPEFASAQLQLAWSLYEQGRDSAEIREPLAAAVRNSDAVSAEEQLFLRASLDFFESRPEDALSTFDALLTLAPDHYWGNRTAGTLCWAAGTQRERDCMRYPIRLAEAAPDNARANFEAAWALALWSNDSQHAQPYIERAQSLVEAEGDLVPALERARIELFPVFESWLVGDSSAVVRGQGEVAERFDAFSDEVQAVVARELGYVSLALGRIGDAESWFRRLPDPAARHEALATLVFAQDDPESLAQHLREGAGYDDPMTPLLFSMAGLKDESEALLARFEESGFEDHYLDLGHGLNAMMVGEVDAAIRQFESSVELLRPDHRGLFFAGADLLAVAFSKKGDLRSAVASLETVAGHRRRAAYMGSGVFWMKCQLRLAGFYREIGRIEDAKQIEARLLDLLADADENYPMRLQLESLVG